MQAGRPRRRPARARRPGGPGRPRLRPRPAPCSARARRSSSAAARPSWASSSPRRRRGLGPVLEDLGQRVAVLAAQVGQQLAALPDRRQALGVRPRWPRPRPAARRRRRPARAADRRRRSARSANGARPASAATPRRRAGRRAAVVAQQQVGRAASAASRWATASARRSSSASSACVLVGSVERGGVELVDLEAEQVELAGPGPVVAAEAARAGVDLSQLGPGRLQRAEVDAAEAVERGPLRPGPGAATGGRAGRAGRPGARPPRPARRRWPAARRRRPGSGRRRARPGAARPLVVARRRSGPRRIASSAAGPHEHGVGPAADEQLDGLDEQRLAGAGLAGERGHARARARARGRSMTPEVRDGQLEPASAAHRSARPNLAFRIWWKSRAPKVTSRAAWLDGRAHDGVAVDQVDHGCAVDARAWPGGGPGPRGGPPRRRRAPACGRRACAARPG